jgi:hypothetical protein
MDLGVTFRKIRGRIIPFRTSRQVGGIAYKSAAEKLIKKNRENVTPHKGYQAAAFGVNVASGVLAGLTAFSKPAIFGAAFAASSGLDVASGALNVKSFAGKDNLRNRAKGILKHEVINNAAGYTAFAATILGSAKGRTKLFRIAVTSPRKIGRLPTTAMNIGLHGTKIARVYGKLALRYGKKFI